MSTSTNFSSTGYRRNFEVKVIAHIEHRRNQMNVAAILVPVTLPMILEYTDFIESEHTQIFLISAVAAVIVLSTLFFIFADKLTIKFFSNRVDCGYKREVKAFTEELKITNSELINKHPHNFLMKSINDIAEAIRHQSEGSDEDDEYSYEDELRALDTLDNFAMKLRIGVFTLSDLELFYEVENLIVIEDYSILDCLLRLEKEINSPKSLLLSRFYHENKLTYDQFQHLRIIAERFISFVITGKGSGNDELDRVLNDAVDKWIKKTSNVIWSPFVIYTDRMSVFIFYEFSKEGTAYAAALMEMLSSNEMQDRKIEIYTLSKEGKGSLKSANGNAAQVGNNDGLVISPDDQIFDIEYKATPPTEVWEDMTIQMGFGGRNDRNTKVGIDTSGKGAVIIREYFVFPMGYSKWAYFGKGGKQSAQQDSLLALVKSSTSMKVEKIADLSASYLFVELFKMPAETGKEENDLKTMKKVILQDMYR